MVLWLFPPAPFLYLFHLCQLLSFNVCWILERTSLCWQFLLENLISSSLLLHNVFSFHASITQLSWVLLFFFFSMIYFSPILFYSWHLFISHILYKLWFCLFPSFSFLLSWASPTHQKLSKHPTPCPPFSTYSQEQGASCPLFIILSPHSFFQSTMWWCYHLLLQLIIPCGLPSDSWSEGRRETLELFSSCDVVRFLFWAGDSRRSWCVFMCVWKDSSKE